MRILFCSPIQPDPAARMGEALAGDSPSRSASWVGGHGIGPDQIAGGPFA